jgi:hypothetical protein
MVLRGAEDDQRVFSVARLSGSLFHQMAPLCRHSTRIGIELHMLTLTLTKARRAV